MTTISELGEKIFSLLKGNNLKIKIFDIDGNEIYDPTMGVRFFVISPNFMITINEEDNCIELHKGKKIDKSNTETIELMAQLQKNLKKLSNEFLMNLNVKIFGKYIQPKDFSYQVKHHIKKRMAESSLYAKLSKIF